MSNEKGAKRASVPVRPLPASRTTYKHVSGFGNQQSTLRPYHPPELMLLRMEFLRTTIGAFPPGAGPNMPRAGCVNSASDNDMVWFLSRDAISACDSRRSGDMFVFSHTAGQGERPTSGRRHMLRRNPYGECLGMKRKAAPIPPRDRARSGRRRRQQAESKNKWNFCEKGFSKNTGFNGTSLVPPFLCPHFRSSKPMSRSSCAYVCQCWPPRGGTAC